MRSPTKRKRRTSIMNSIMYALLPCVTKRTFQNDENIELEQDARSSGGNSEDAKGGIDLQLAFLETLGQNISKKETPRAKVNEILKEIIESSSGGSTTPELLTSANGRTEPPFKDIRSQYDGIQLRSVNRGNLEEFLPSSILQNSFKQCSESSCSGEDGVEDTIDWKFSSREMNENPELVKPQMCSSECSRRNSWPGASSRPLPSISAAAFSMARYNSQEA